MSDGSLSGRRVVVTGSSIGIGAAVARQAVAAGARVAGLARGVEPGERDGVLSIKCDVREAGSVEQAMAQASERLGGIDALVVNAGYGLYGHITKGNPADWKDLYETNVLGALYTIYYGYRHFPEQGRRDIVTMSSISGRSARLGAGVYAGTKFALNAISESLRLELAEAHVRVTVIEPATVDTPFYERAVRHEGAGIIPRNFDPLTAEDVAGGVIWALSQSDNVAINEVLMRPNGQST